MTWKFTDGIEVLNTGYGGGLNALPRSSYTTTKWPWGQVPRTCAEQSKEWKLCNVYDLEVYEVTYSDVSVLNTR